MVLTYQLASGVRETSGYIGLLLVWAEGRWLPGAIGPDWGT